ncbi:MAG: 2-phosphosulfolactate phosphatase [Clostridia bacterium]|nr:2-phosphosulfolactate phosphatase [Clostridia bacterium]
MNIEILQLIEGARQAKGLAVIIDVFRAFTVECYIARNGAERIYAVGDKEIAYSYKREHPDCLLIGEREGVKLPGFDFGNSPSDVEKFDFCGKTAVHTTSAGTQGVDNAINADEIITGSLCNARAVAEYIRRGNYRQVSLVCMGLGGKKPTQEDTLCAEYIKSLLEGTDIDLQNRMYELRYTSGAKFFDKEKQHIFPEADFHLCCSPDLFSFVLRAEKVGNMYRMVRINVE